MLPTLSMPFHFYSEPFLGGLPFCAVQGKDFDKVLSLKNMQAFLIVLYSLVVFCDQSV
jgi:hypothetical protein